MAAAVMRDAAVPVGAKRNHLVFPRVGAEWPAMAEDHGLSASPVLVINLRAVFRRDPHGFGSSGSRLTPMKYAGRLGNDGMGTCVCCIEQEKRAQIGRASCRERV